MKLYDVGTLAAAGLFIAGIFVGDQTDHDVYERPEECVTKAANGDYFVFTKFGVENPALCDHPSLKQDGPAPAVAESDDDDDTGGDDTGGDDTSSES